MPRMVTIVMYHFVRDLERSRYPRIKGLPLTGFRNQLDYFQRHYNIVRMEQVMAAAQGEREALPPRALLLTFDDGYLDHYLNVLPILDERSLQGSFFPAGKPVSEARVLDVNKIHFVLASVEDPGELVTTVFAELDRHRNRLGLNSNAEYYERVLRDGRYDTPDVLFVKRMLQRELPESFRVELIDTLFKRYVTGDEAAFSAELYMGADQLRHLLRAGMYVGSHGYEHYWMDTLSPLEQAREVDVSLEFLAGLGVETDRWVMCYPYGAYNGSLLAVLRERGCVLGLSTDVAIADLDQCDPLTLSRLDTNDLPKDRNAPIDSWTKAVIQGAAAGKIPKQPIF